MFIKFKQGIALFLALAMVSGCSLTSSNQQADESVKKEPSHASTSAGQKEAAVKAGNAPDEADYQINQELVDLVGERAIGGFVHTSEEYYSAMDSWVNFISGYLPAEALEEEEVTEALKAAKSMNFDSDFVYYIYSQEEYINYEDFQDPKKVANEHICLMLDVKINNAGTIQEIMDDEKFDWQQIANQLQLAAVMLKPYAVLLSKYDKRTLSVALTSNACTSREEGVFAAIVDYSSALSENVSFHAHDKKFFTALFNEQNLNKLMAIYDKFVAERVAEIAKEYPGYDEKLLKQFPRDFLKPVTETILWQIESDFVRGAVLSVDYGKGDRRRELYFEFSKPDILPVFEKWVTSRAYSGIIWAKSLDNLQVASSIDGNELRMVQEWKGGGYISYLGDFGSLSPVAISVVVGILATGASAVYASAQKKARDSIRHIHFQEISAMLAEYHEEHGKYPVSLDEIGNKLDPFRDPSGERYYYTVGESGEWFRLHIKMERANTHDMILTEKDMLITG